jgi:micrococcal nuclease
MNRRLAYLAVVAVLAVAGYACDVSGVTGTSSSPSPGTIGRTAPGANGPADDVVVVGRVVDGDTFVTTTGERVRLIGVDTPESTRGADECFGREAAAALASMLPSGSEAELRFDVELLDRYDRTLAYVTNADGVFVNAELVASGYAEPMRIAPNTAYAEKFASLYAQAKDSGAGLHTACASAR